MIHENLIFVVCAPRSGSTLLQRMIGSHSAVYTHPEPHLLTPLNYLGYFDTVDKAPYDHINAAQAMRELCDELPNGEADYLDACRAYASTIYERVLAKTGKTYFLDKTPAYALVLPFVTKLYPEAKYVVLTRHPMAILHSQAHSFFGGDYRAAHETNPLLKPYLQAIGAFLAEAPVPHVRVRYEDLVQDPKAEMQRVLTHLGLPFEDGCVEYGKQKHISKSYGDPMAVERHDRPVTDSVETWANDLLARPEALAMARQILDEVDPAWLSAWGYPKERLFDALAGKNAKTTRTASVNTYRLKRSVLLHLRKNIHQNALGDAVKKVRYYCDVLLRT
ncbi:MAG: sulfotransferase [Deltaproteobacteria bacterium]|nr:sulfotransferase [Deltaproteobacteria bacterium]